MNKKNLLFFIVLASGFLVSSCIEEPLVIQSDAIYVGDSNCVPGVTVPRTTMVPHLAGINSDCRSGRKLVDYHDLPNVSAVFLALGVNDALEGVPPQTYGLHLTNLLATTNGVVYCILPVLGPQATASDTAYQTEMKNRCANVINPRQFSNIPGFWDGIHWTSKNHHEFAPAVISRI